MLPNTPAACPTVPTDLTKPPVAEAILPRYLLIAACCSSAVPFRALRSPSPAKLAPPLIIARLVPASVMGVSSPRKRFLTSSTAAVPNGAAMASIFCTAADDALSNPSLNV